MMVLLMALFAQSPLPFLGSLALWVGLCSAGAARYRNFRAYGFVLAGYTAAMVGLPALAHPEGSFMSAVWRVVEISLGILCSTAISAAVLPQSSSAAMHNALYLRFGGFARFVVNGLRGDISRAEFETGNVRFVAEAIGLEGLRSVTVFEDPHMRRRNGRLNRLNSEFMAVTTRFNALHQLLERLRLEQADQVLKHIDPGLEHLAELLDGFADRALTNDDAALLVTRLESCRSTFPSGSEACAPSWSAPCPVTPNDWTFTPRSSCCTACSASCSTTHEPTHHWPTTAMSVNSGRARSYRVPTG